MCGRGVGGVDLEKFCCTTKLLTMQYSHRGSVISLSKVESGSVITTNITLETMRAFFSCVNCEVVVNSLTCSGLSDFTQ
jgi:hypothetical protein